MNGTIECFPGRRHSWSENSHCLYPPSSPAKHCTRETTLLVSVLSIFSGGCRYNHQYLFEDTPGDEAFFLSVALNAPATALFVSQDQIHGRGWDSRSASEDVSVDNSGRDLVVFNQTYTVEPRLS